MDTGSQRAHIGARVPMHLVMGVTKEQFSDDLDTTTGPYSGNPGSLVTLHIAAANNRLVTSTVVATVKLRFWTMFYSRAQLPQS